MPIPDVQNVFRRGGAYWWRRTLTWLDRDAHPITLALSLGTKDLGVARRRAAAMTAQSEVVRMGLYERVGQEGLTSGQRDAVMRSEMRAYRDVLEHLTAAWQFQPTWAKVTDIDADLRVYEAIWGAFARTGVVDGAPSRAYAEDQLTGLDEQEREAARRLLGAVDIRHSLSVEAAERLRELAIIPAHCSRPAR